MEGSEKTATVTDVRPRQAERSGRLRWPDVAKGVAILLVVIGHTLRGLVNSGVVAPSAAVMYVDTWIYAFHMPVFFFVSGLFAARSVTRPARSYVGNKLATLAYPYFLWSSITLLLMKLAGGRTNNDLSAQALWKLPVEPIMQYWFLYCLLIIFLLYLAWNRCGASDRLFLVGAAAVHVLQACGPPCAWAVADQVAQYMLYFATGLVLRDWLAAGVTQWKRGTLVTWATLLLVGVSVMAYCLGQAPQGHGRWFDLLGTVAALWGIAGVVCASVVLGRIGRCWWLGYLGRMSLPIFVAHTIASAATRIVLQSGIGIANSVIHVVLGVAMGLCVPLVLAYADQRWGGGYLFTLKSSAGRGPGRAEQNALSAPDRDAAPGALSRG
jgi:fucose 4-O-acetylase-like acetyltransferase